MVRSMFGSFIASVLGDIYRGEGKSRETEKFKWLLDLRVALHLRFLHAAA